MVLISSVFVQIIQIQNNINTVGETISFLQGFIQVKVDNVVHIINVTPKDQKGKQVKTTADFSSPIATTIWDKLCA
ncbi:MAG: hypothetical protein BWY74_02138 [Firmicutes bacterium ADurb.Bin419]|nr:MAG: hypothetical protein BWY74_02138 [Firmicutes bacterium ADurb.Bin419]